MSGCTLLDRNNKPLQVDGPTCDEIMYLRKCVEELQEAQRVLQAEHDDLKEVDECHDGIVAIYKNDIAHEKLGSSIAFDLWELEREKNKELLQSQRVLAKENRYMHKYITCLARGIPTPHTATSILSALPSMQEDK